MISEKDKKRISVHLDQALVDRIDNYCNRFSLSRNSGIALLCTQALNADDLQNSMKEFSSVKEFLEAQFSELRNSSGEKSTFT